MLGLLLPISSGPLAGPARYGTGVLYGVNRRYAEPTTPYLPERPPATRGFTAEAVALPSYTPEGAPHAPVYEEG